MSRRRKTTKRKTTRRRKMSGMGKLNPSGILTTIGGVLVGTAAAGFIAKKFLSTQNDTIQALVPIALGIATPMFLKSDLGKYAGAGMVAVGGLKLFQKFGIAGIGETDVMLPVGISGDDLSVLAGDDNFAMANDDIYAMAGDDDISVLAGMEESEY
jgi:hypothetical protein